MAGCQVMLFDAEQKYIELKFRLEDGESTQVLTYLPEGQRGQFCQIQEE